VTPFLDSSELRGAVYPVSVGFYHEASRLGMIGEDVELLEGVIFRKMAKSPLHEWLIEFFKRHLEAVCGPGFFVGKERPITCARSEPEPDLAVFSGDWTDYKDHHPTTAALVVEISINTQVRDLGKAAIYAEAGVSEYWLVEPEAGRITIHTEPAGTEYGKAVVFGKGERAVGTVFPTLAVKVDEIAA
jgi:Uma2 family endonuclease